jgi:hypothetical protein
MSADQLRRAAAKLRETAKAATPGPWHPAQPMLADMVTSPLLGHIADCSVGTGYRHQSLEDARWISLVNPSIAEPLALWLEFAAEHWRPEAMRKQYPIRLDLQHRTIEIACALLGEEAEPDA